MSTTRRTARLNSLLREVISEVIHREVGNPNISQLITITKVEITTDLHHAKVFFSVIGPDIEKEHTLQALQSAAGYISVLASKKVVMRFFPELTFKIDDSVEHHMRVEEILQKIRKENESRGPVEE